MLRYLDRLSDTLWLRMRYLPTTAACAATAILILSSPVAANANSAIGEVKIDIEYDPGIGVTFTPLMIENAEAGDGAHNERGEGAAGPDINNSYSINFFAEAVALFPPDSRSVSATFIRQLGVFASVANNTPSALSFGFKSSIDFFGDAAAPLPGDAALLWGFAVNSSIKQAGGLVVGSPFKVIDFEDNIFTPFPLAEQVPYTKEVFINVNLLPGEIQQLSIDKAFIRARARTVPGPLPILGAGAAFGFSRKLRKRIKSSKSDLISTTAL
jgi:hypothetical protein